MVKALLILLCVVVVHAEVHPHGRKLDVNGGTPWEESSALIVERVLGRFDRNLASKMSQIAVMCYGHPTLLTRPSSPLLLSLGQKARAERIQQVPQSGQLQGAGAGRILRPPLGVPLPRGGAVWEERTSHAGRILGALVAAPRDRRRREAHRQLHVRLQDRRRRAAGVLQIVL